MQTATLLRWQLSGNETQSGMHPSSLVYSQVSRFTFEIGPLLRSLTSSDKDGLVMMCLCGAPLGIASPLNLFDLGASYAWYNR